MLSDAHADFRGASAGRYDRGHRSAGYGSDLIGAGYDSGSPSLSQASGFAGDSSGTPAPSTGSGASGMNLESDAESVPTPTFPESPETSPAGPCTMFSPTGRLQTVAEAEGEAGGTAQPTFGRRLKDALSPSCHR